MYNMPDEKRKRRLRYYKLLSEKAAKLDPGKVSFTLIHTHSHSFTPIHTHSYSFTLIHTHSHSFTGERGGPRREGGIIPPDERSFEEGSVTHHLREEGAGQDVLEAEQAEHCQAEEGHHHHLMSTMVFVSVH